MTQALPELHASGFTDSLIALNGVYTLQADQNHNKCHYKKETTEIEGCDTSCIYFWDERDGEQLSGWWVAPIVGGEQVWSFNPSKSTVPPSAGWRVPWHENAPNAAIKMIMKPATSKRPADASAAGGTAAKQQKTGEAGAAATANPIDANVHPSVLLRQTKTLQNLDSQVGNIEKAVERCLDAELGTAELQRAMQVAKNSIISTNKFVDAQEKQSFQNEQAAKLQPIRDRIKQAEEKLATREKEVEAEVAKKLGDLEKDLPEKCKEMLSELESHVETTKDESVLLTCELGEHSSPEDIVEIDVKVQETSTKAVAAQQQIKDYLASCQAMFRMMPDEKLGALRQIVDKTQKDAELHMKDLAEVKRQIDTPIKKARSAILQKKMQEEEERKRQEKMRLAERTKVKSHRASEIGMYSDYLVKQLASETELTSRSIEKTQSMVLGLHDVLQADLDHKDTKESGALKGVLNKALQRVKKGLLSLHLKAKEVREKSQEEDDKFAVFLSNEISARMTEQKQTPEDLFKEVAGSDDVELVGYEKVVSWFVDVLLAGGGAENVSLLKKYLPGAWRKAVTCKARGLLATENKPEPGWTEEKKKEEMAKILNHEVDEDDALKESISSNEWSLFIIAAHYICVSNCFVTNAKDTVAVTKDTSKEQLKGQLDPDDVVRVLDGPESVTYQPTGQAPYEVMRVEIERPRDGLRGWVNMREPKNSFDNLSKYSNGYEIKQETVLTNTYELKGFKVIRRVKKDEKVLALSVPQFNRDAELTRVKVKATIDGAEGWITVKGSHGTLFLQSLAVGDSQQQIQQRMMNPAAMLNFNRDAETGRSYIVQEGEAKKKTYGRETTDELLEQELGGVADALPKQSAQRLEDIASVRQKCEDILLKLEDMNEKTSLVEVSVDAIMAEKEDMDAILGSDDESETEAKEAEAKDDEAKDAAGDATMTDVAAKPTPSKAAETAAKAAKKALKAASKDPKLSGGMHENFDKECAELISSCDNMLRKVNQEMNGIKQDMQLYFTDLQAVKLPQEVQDYLRSKTPAAPKEPTKDADGNVVMTDAGEEKEKEADSSEPDVGAMKPMLRLKYNLLLMQKQLERDAAFVRETQRRKMAQRDDLNRKFAAFRKSVEVRMLKRMVLKLNAQVEQRMSDLGEMDQKKVAIKFEITGEEAAPAAVVSSGEGGKEAGEDTPEADEEGTSPGRKPQEKPVHSAAKLCHLGIEFEQQVEKMEQYITELGQWLQDSDPMKLVSNKDQWKLITSQEKATCVQTVSKPFLQLRAKANQLRAKFKEDREYATSSLQQDVLLRSRTEIATYFRENEAEKIFKEILVEKNPANKSIEKEDQKFITCDIVCDYMNEVMQPEAIPKAIISRIYSVLVGNHKRPMTCDEFCNLFAKMHWRALRRSIMTKEFELRGKFEKVANVQVGDIVRLIGDVKKTGDDMMRFEAETIPPPDESGSASTRGWVTLYGNQGAAWFVLHTPGYKVVKQTVLTDIFEMKDFRPVVRLNVGDQVRAIAFPRKESKSGLIRVKAVTVGHKTGKEYTGYVTVEGNQNSVYLESCEHLVFPDEEPEDAEAGKKVEL
ncbi:unnamed protein product [Amoebophrya sp. A25]|nr:unnamed protein product [Amoebophrya sp. A25]|eukprot:GSA25T00003585001.1